MTAPLNINNFPLVYNRSDQIQCALFTAVDLILVR